MMIFLLLILSLNTGFVALVDVQGCTGVWVEFTCKNPNKNDQIVKVETPRGVIKQIKQNEWKKDNGRFLFHNTTEKHLRMIVKPLGKQDFGNYKCKFNEEEVNFTLSNSGSVCDKDSVQTTHRTAQTTINCSQQDFNFICKENSFTCDIILRQTSPVKTINNVGLQDAGVYWCGTESQSYKVSRQKIHLDVKVASSTVSTISSTAQDTVYNTVYSTETTRKQAVHWKTYNIVKAVLVAVLLLLAVFFIYKRFNCFNNTTKRNEEHCYENINGRPQEPDSGTARRTIGTTPH